MYAAILLAICAVLGAAHWWALRCIDRQYDSLRRAKRLER